MKNIIGLGLIIFFINFQIVFSQTDSLNISWDRNAEDDVTYYILYRAISQDTNLIISDYDSLMAIVQSPAGSARVDTTDRDNVVITPGNFISYVVVAVDTGGLKSFFSDSDGAGIPIINWQRTQIDSGITTNVPFTEFLSDPDHSVSVIQDSIIQRTNLIVNRNGNNLTLTPEPITHAGSASFVLRMTDPEGFWDQDTIFLNIVTNAPPVVSDIPDTTINEGESFPTIDLDNYVADPDNPDDQISWNYSGNSDLAVSISPLRVATISIPDTNWNGEETITFIATDPGGRSDSDFASFRVEGINDPPHIVSSPVTGATKDSLYSYQVVAEDPDSAYGEILTFSLIAAPNFLNINQGTGLISGTPAVSDTGIFPVSIEVQDLLNATDTQNYLLTVLSENEKPVVSDIPDQTILEGEEFENISLDSYVNDPDHPDNEIIWTASGNNDLTITIDQNRIASITIPSLNWVGTEAITLTATDPGGLSDNDEAKFTAIGTPNLDTLIIEWLPQGQSANFEIITDALTKVILDYWLEPSLTSTYRSNNFAERHIFDLPNLISDTTYSFSLSLEDTLGFMITILDSIFQTGPGSFTESIGNPFVFPNPFRPAKGHDHVYLDNLPVETKEIRIFTPTTAELVYSEKVDGSRQRRWRWNVVNKDKKELASGFYIYVIMGSGDKKLKSGKIAVIR